MQLITIINKTQLTRVRPEDVVYLEADGNYTHMVLCSGKSFTFTRKIKDFYEVLNMIEHSPFLKVGRSLIVNKNYIFQVNSIESRITLAGNGLSKEFSVVTRKEPVCELLERLKMEVG